MSSSRKSAKKSSNAKKSTSSSSRGKGKGKSGRSGKVREKTKEREPSSDFDGSYEKGFLDTCTCLTPFTASIHVDFDSTKDKGFASKSLAVTEHSLEAGLNSSAGWDNIQGITSQFDDFNLGGYQLSNNIQRLYIMALPSLQISDSRVADYSSGQISVFEEPPFQTPSSGGHYGFINEYSEESCAEDSFFKPAEDVFKQSKPGTISVSAHKFYAVQKDKPLEFLVHTSNRASKAPVYTPKWSAKHESAPSLKEERLEKLNILSLG